MNEVFVDNYNIITGLGTTAEENYINSLAGISGVKSHVRNEIDELPVWASLIEEGHLQQLNNTIIEPERYTKYEILQISSIADAAKTSDIDLTSSETVFIFSTTKGNISLLENHDVNEELIHRMSLSHSAKLVTEYFNNTNEPVVISNACISGLVAIMYAKRLLQNGIYKNAVVTGADVISRFVYSGFKSFLALSAGPCHPFSENRDGINLGEAAATVLLTTALSGKSKNIIRVLDGSVSNDSNHISGPSRSGDELGHAIGQVLKSSGITAEQIGFISAHGTATIFNDEMEAKAFHSAGLSKTPVNSLKGYFGHTLGAAGLVESIISIQSLIKGEMLPTMGFTTPGVSVEINVSNSPIKIKSNYCLKTASGFGGCNAAILFSKS